MPSFLFYFSINGNICPTSLHGSDFFFFFLQIGFPDCMSLPGNGISDTYVCIEMVSCVGGLWQCRVGDSFVLPAIPLYSHLGH